MNTTNTRTLTGDELFLKGKVRKHRHQGELWARCDRCGAPAHAVIHSWR